MIEFAKVGVETFSMAKNVVLTQTYVISTQWTLKTQISEKIKKFEFFAHYKKIGI